MLPMVAVPTTAGTGSECQSFALISQEGTHVKMACGDVKSAPRSAILDPLLTLTQPHAVASATGIDALAHAIESAVTRCRNPISQMLSREAFRLGASALRRILADPADVNARGRMLIAAAVAGMAIKTSMLGAAHAAANPITARFGAIHGQAVGMMLPAVVRYNAEDPETREMYQALALDAGVVSERGDPVQGAAALADFLEETLALAGLPRCLASR